MEQENIYYRAGGKITHAGCEILDGGKDTDFVIDYIEFKDEEMVNGRKENGIWLMHFKQNPYTSLPVILNSTNKKRLVKLFPECEGFLARIKGKAVKMTKELTKDPNGGGQTFGLRVSMIPAEQPKAAAKKIIPIDKAEAIVAWAKEKGYNIEQVKAAYDMSAEVEAIIVKGLA